MKKISIVLLTAAAFAFTASCSLFGVAKKTDVDSVNTMAMLGLALPQAPVIPDDTTVCFTCHSDSTELGQKIRWAQAGWDASVHKNGTNERIIGSQFRCVDTSKAAYSACTGTGFSWVNEASVCQDTTKTDATTCTGGTLVWKQIWVTIGFENAGTNAFYTNGGGCQVCHTDEGFRKKISGGYADNYAVVTGYITNPSPIGCFTCHTAHTSKSMTTLRVPNGTAVKTDTGTYSKEGGNLCANCHRARMFTFSTTAATPSLTGLNCTVLGSASGTTNYSCADGQSAVQAQLQNAGSSGLGFSRLAPHDSPQADVIIGGSGAHFTSAGSYSSMGSHTAMAGATCDACHMTQPDARGGLDANIGGHGFQIKGVVHGSNVINIAGCTKTTGCHGTDVAASKQVAVKTIAGSSGSPLITAPTGYLKAGEPYIQMGTSGTQLIQQMNEIMVKLADPSANCTGLLATTVASQYTGKSITWATFPDGTVNPACSISGGSVAKTTSPTANQLAVLNAIWNFKLVQNEKSWGVHNSKYLLTLLYDSCKALETVNGSGCTLTLTTARPQ